jgi:hypothetical protein
MIQHKQTNKEITEFRKKLKYIFGNFCIHTTNNSKMSLALLLENAIPKGYKMVGGKLVRKRIKFLRPLFVLANGLSTDYNGYFGILPDGVFQYIFQIATEMLEHEKKVEWNNRLAWSHTNGERPMSCFGIPATDYYNMMNPVWEEGDIIHNDNHNNRGWWRVDKKTPKTVVLRMLETERERVVADTRPNKYRGNDDYVCSKYARLTGKYVSTEIPENRYKFFEDLANGTPLPEQTKVYKELKTHYRQNAQKTFFINRKLPFGFHREVRLFKSEWGNMPKTLADCAGRWVEMVETVKSTPL